VLALALALGLAPLSGAHAATPTVCPSGCAYSSIQAAINAAAWGDTITIGAGRYTENLTLNASLTLQGAGDGQTIVDGGGTGTVVTVNHWGSVTLSGLTLTHGNAPAGGGIDNEVGTVILQNSTVSGNSTSAGGGGGIFNNDGTLTLQNSTVSGNSAAGGAGGGVWNANGTTTLHNSTVSGNSGGGIGIYAGTVTLQGSIVAKQASSGDCLNLHGTLVSQGYNLDSDHSCNLTQPTDQPGVDPLLGPLQDNGGPTPTMMPLAGSPAIDAIPRAACAVTTDERGVARPQGGACDSGAVEVQDTTPPVITPTVSGPRGANGWYVGDVQVSWTLAEPESRITAQAGCAPTTISTDTPGTTLTCSATSGGGISSQSVTIKRDATAPTITASATTADGAPYTAGAWTDQSVTVHYSCSDSGSGLATCPADQVYSTDGATTASGTATDNAGNTASASVTYRVVYPPLTLALGVTSSPSGPVTTGSTVTMAGTLANHSMAAEVVTLKATLTYVSPSGQHVTVSGSSRAVTLAAGQTLGQPLSFTISKYVPRGSYTVALRATDTAGDTASGSASLTVV